MQLEGTDDDVVAVIPVFNATAMFGALHIFQYPARSDVNPYQHDVADVHFSTDANAPGQHTASDVPSCLFVEGKAPPPPPSASPRGPGIERLVTPSSRLTMHCTLNTLHSASFRPKQAQSVCENYYGNLEEKKRSIHGGVSEHEYTYTLQSRPYQPRSHYLVAAIDENGIHLNSVATVQQLTPLLRSASNEPDMTDDGASFDEGGRDEAQAGMPRVPQAFCSVPGASSMVGGGAYERDRREMMRQRSSMLNSLADAARRLVFEKQGTPRSLHIRRQLVCPTHEQIFVLPVLLESKAAQQTSIANRLFPPEILISGAITGGEEAMQSTIIRSFACYFPVSEQVQQLMMRCQVLPFHVIRNSIFVTGQADGSDRGNHATSTSASSLASPSARLDNLIVGALRFCAMYMHGVWVNRMDDQFRGAAAALREVILLEFWSHTRARIARRQFYRFRLHTGFRQRALDILRTLADLCGRAGERAWTLKYAYSDDAVDVEQVNKFDRTFAAEVDAQSQAWQQARHRMNTLLPSIASGRAPAHLLLVSRDLLSSYQLSANRQLSDGTGGSAWVYGAGAGGARVGEKPAPSPSSTSVPGERGGNAELGPIRQHIRSLFLDYGVINKQRAKELVLQARDRHYPAATNAMLSAALQESVQAFTPSTWILKDMRDPNIDRFRPVIVAAALELSSFTIKMLAATATSKLCDAQSPFYLPDAAVAPGSGDIVGVRVTGQRDNAAVSGCPIPQITLQRVAGEIAEYSPGERLWHIKSGNVMHAQ